jgi:hypothetical protein
MSGIYNSFFKISYINIISAIDILSKKAFYREDDVVLEITDLVNFNIYIIQD